MLNLTTTTILTTASLGLNETKHRAWSAFQATAAGRVESTYDLGAEGVLAYVMVESPADHHRFNAHWEHRLPGARGRQEFHGECGDQCALQLIAARVAAAPAALAAARAARRAEG